MIYACWSLPHLVEYIQLFHCIKRISDMTFQYPCRVRLKPINRLVGLLFKGYKIDVVIMSHGRLVRMQGVKCDVLDGIWTTGIEFIKIPPYHKVELIEELS